MVNNENSVAKVATLEYSFILCNHKVNDATNLLLDLFSNYDYLSHIIAFFSVALTNNCTANYV